MTDIATVLETAILSPDQKLRQEAEAYLANAAKEHFVPYLGLLSGALANQQQKTEVRVLAGIALKNELSAKDAITKLRYTERWVAVDVEAKKQIKETALQALISADTQVANAAAQLVSAIADIELPRNEWPELMPVLVESTQPKQAENVKRAALLSIGYICETADSNNSGVVAQSNGILTAIVQGAQASEPSTTVRYTAIMALVNSLEFIRNNFEREGERNYIMQVVCEATQAKDVKLQAAAFGALARIMSLYYPYMKLYMEKALYGLTVEGMKSSNGSVSCMAVEFWSTVCEEEAEISLMQEEFYADGTGEHHNFEFAKYAINEVLPTLLTLLTRQDEDAEDDEWNVSMAAAACLQLFAETTGSAVVSLTLQFVEQNLTQEDWRKREAAVMAFGSILVGPDNGTLVHIVSQALPPMLVLMTDTVLQVKDTVAWCLGRIADLVIGGIDLEVQLPAVMRTLLGGLQDHPKVSTNCCWAMINLAEQLGSDDPDEPSTKLSPYYESLMQGLIQASSRTDNEYSARTSAYEAIGALVTYSAQDTLPYIKELSLLVVERLEATMAMQTQLVGIDDRSNLEDLQMSLLVLLTYIIRRLKPTDRESSDRLMTMLLSLLQNKLPNSLIEEELFLVVTALTNVLGANFDVYVDAFLPYLVKALEDSDSPTCKVAVGLVSDLAASLAEAMEPYCDTIMNVFLTNLQNTTVRRDVKVSILSTFGDIAVAIGSAFEKYMPVVMQVLGQASTLRKDVDSPADVGDYIGQLRQAIVQAYSGIVQGMRERTETMLQYVRPIFGFLSLVCTDQIVMRDASVVQSSVGIIGDIASMYSHGEVKEFFQEEWITDVIRRARSDYPKDTTLIETAKWARELQKLQLAF
ncbi:armadillo-type protein [Dipodascopsis tothii]|uniref:armadillo-type protein n=1 Tax=Dipodascopsis tothii TaxID=44089 RepID=UPI0034CEE064